MATNETTDDIADLLKSLLTLQPTNGTSNGGGGASQKLLLCLLRGLDTSTLSIGAGGAASDDAESKSLDSLLLKLLTSTVISATAEYDRHKEGPDAAPYELELINNQSEAIQIIFLLMDLIATRGSFNDLDLFLLAQVVECRLNLMEDPEAAVDQVTKTGCSLGNKLKHKIWIHGLQLRIKHERPVLPEHWGVLRLIGCDLILLKHSHADAASPFWFDYLIKTSIPTLLLSLPTDALQRFTPTFQSFLDPVAKSDPLRLLDIACSILFNIPNGANQQSLVDLFQAPRLVSALIQCLGSLKSGLVRKKARHVCSTLGLIGENLHLLLDALENKQAHLIEPILAGHLDDLLAAADAPRIEVLVRRMRTHDLRLVRRWALKVLSSSAGKLSKSFLLSEGILLMNTNDVYFHPNDVKTGSPEDQADELRQMSHFLSDCSVAEIVGTLCAAQRLELKPIGMFTILSHLADHHRQTGFVFRNDADAVQTDLVERSRKLVQVVIPAVFESATIRSAAQVLLVRIVFDGLTQQAALPEFVNRRDELLAARDKFLFHILPALNTSELRADRLRRWIPLESIRIPLDGVLGGGKGTDTIGLRLVACYAGWSGDSTVKQHLLDQICLLEVQNGCDGDGDNLRELREIWTSFFAFSATVSKEDLVSALPYLDYETLVYSLSGKLTFDLLAILKENPTIGVTFDLLAAALKLQLVELDPARLEQIRRHAATLFRKTSDGQKLDCGSHSMWRSLIQLQKRLPPASLDLIAADLETGEALISPRLVSVAGDTSSPLEFWTDLLDLVPYDCVTHVVRLFGLVNSRRQEALAAGDFATFFRTGLSHAKSPRASRLFRVAVKSLFVAMVTLQNAAADASGDSSRSYWTTIRDLYDAVKEMSIEITTTVLLVILKRVQIRRQEVDLKTSENCFLEFLIDGLLVFRVTPSLLNNIARDVESDPQYGDLFQWNACKSVYCDAATRRAALKAIFRLPLDERLALVDRVAARQADLYAANPLVFPNAPLHRGLNRIWQFLFLLLLSTQKGPLGEEAAATDDDDYAEKMADKIWTLTIADLVAVSQSQLSVKVLQQLIVVYLVRRRVARFGPKLADFLDEVIRRNPNPPLFLIISVLNILFHLVDLRELVDQLAPIPVLCLLKSNYFRIRIIAHLVVDKIQRLHPQRSGGGFIQTAVSQSPTAIPVDLPWRGASNVVVLMDRFAADWYYSLLDPRVDLTVEFLFADFLRLSNVTPDDFASRDEIRWICDQFVGCRDARGFLSDERRRQQRWAAAEPSHIMAKDRFDEEERAKEDLLAAKTRAANAIFQRKHQLSQELSEVKGHEGLLSNVRKTTAAAASGGLIVCASLVDRLPNLGGLCRTCEIFGAAKLVIHSSKVLLDKEFTSLSVTSEQWVPIEEVRGHNGLSGEAAARDGLTDLKDYLSRMKSLNGYTLVGVEQAQGSRPLHEVQLPRNSLLLLGNENEGLPADLLSLMDLVVEVPQAGLIRSLNVHVTGALIIWEYFKQHSLGPKSC